MLLGCNRCCTGATRKNQGGPNHESSKGGTLPLETLVSQINIYPHFRFPMGPPFPSYLLRPFFYPSPNPRIARPTLSVLQSILADIFRTASRRTDRMSQDPTNPFQSRRQDPIRPLTPEDLPNYTPPHNVTSHSIPEGVPVHSDIGYTEAELLSFAKNWSSVAPNLSPEEARGIFQLFLQNPDIMRAFYDEQRNWRMLSRVFERERTALLDRAEAHARTPLLAPAPNSALPIFMVTMDHTDLLALICCVEYALNATAELPVADRLCFPDLLKQMRGVLAAGPL